jgi:hypothetical protein
MRPGAGMDVTFIQNTIKTSGLERPAIAFATLQSFEGIMLWKDRRI